MMQILLTLAKWTQRKQKPGLKKNNKKGGITTALKPRKDLKTMTSEAQKKAVKKYKRNVKRITVDFGPTEINLFEQISKQPKKQTYIKDLVRADMAERKPFAVEELKTLPLHTWVWIEVLEPFDYEEKVSAYYRKQDDYTRDKAFCCGYPGISFSFDYKDYSETWIAYTHQPTNNNYYPTQKPNEAVQLLREPYPRNLLLALIHSSPWEIPLPEETSDLYMRLQKIVCQSSEWEQEVILLRFVERRSYEKVGKLLCVTEERARQITNLTLRNLRAQLFGPQLGESASPAEKERN